jgi:1-aminocyclopropane-1-carboxylate deaminase/D-cysteine desulfhydrase-like pyridoxal-dependent ACC family enzyme
MAKPKAKTFMTGAAHGGGNFNDQVFAKKAQTASLKGGLTMGTTIHPYDGQDGGIASSAGTSIFDPVLCEVAYRWFSPPGGTILDPFAGGSVRGIVASKLGRQYVGVDLRAEQVEANDAQAGEICEDPMPIWYEGDSREIATITAGVAADFIFSCPPYADLEVYSDDPRDLSTLGYSEFREAYFEIVKEACSLLKPNRFAAFVVGEVRGKGGAYYGFVPDTIEAFRRAGLSYYNETILITAAGSLPIRAGKQFEATRKLGKTHQNLLIFVKGDPKVATAAIGPVEFGAFEAEGEEADEEPELVDERSGQDFTPDLTPIQAAGEVWLKRDDLWQIAGVPGGKVRTCWHLAQGAPGLVTAGSRASPQVNIVAHIAARLGIPCRAHVPSGDLSPEVLAAREAGAEIVQHKPGYNTVIVARARDDAAARGWREIPFGMECAEAVNQTRKQVRDLPAGVSRIVVPVGSGMSLCGVLWGLIDAGLSIPVLGVVVGASPDKRLEEYAPMGWRDMATLVPSGVDYHQAVSARVGGVLLDPHYEAKCARFLKPGDMLWIVGIRASETRKGSPKAPL